MSSIKSINAVSTSTLADNAAMVAANGIPVIGNLVWFAVPDLTINESDLDSIGAAHGYATSSLPKPKNVTDAFRCATTPQQKRGESRQVRYLMRHVLDNATEIVRHVVRENVDRAGRKLSHTTIAEIKLDKAAERVWWAVKPEATANDRAVVEPMLQAAHDEFNATRGKLSGGEIHRWVMRQLNRMCHVSVHPNGGVYFVPSFADNALDRLGKFVAEVSRRSHMPHVWVQSPVLRVESIVNQIDTSAREDITASINELSAEVAELLNKETRPARDVIDERVKRLLEMRRKADTYTKLLGTKIEDVTIKGEIIDAQLDELLQRSTGAQADAVVTKLAAAAKSKGFRSQARGRDLIVSGRRSTLTLRSSTRGWLFKASTSRLLGAMTARDEFDAHKRTFKTKERDVAELLVATAIGNMT